MAEWLSSWLAEQEDRGSIPGLATWIFRDWLSPASKSRYGWKIAKSTLLIKTTNQPTNQYLNFWSHDLDLQRLPTFEKKLNLYIYFWIKRDRSFILCMCILYGMTFLPVTKFWSCNIDLHLWPTFEKNLTFALAFEPKEILIENKSGGGGYKSC